MLKLGWDRTFQPYLLPDFIWRRTHMGQKWYEHVKTVHEIIRGTVDSRKAEVLAGKEVLKKPQDGGTLLDSLLCHHLVGDLPLTGVYEELTITLFGAHDTMSPVLDAVIYLLGRYEKCQERARNEVDSLWARHSKLAETGQVTTSMVTELKYVECCLKEAMRLYPSVPVLGRRVGKGDPVIVDDRHIPEGVWLIIHLMAMHRNPKYWPRAAQYDPDRFAPENGGEAKWALCAPFSHGARGCIGRKMGWLELMITVAQLLRQTRWQSLDIEDAIQWDIKVAHRAVTPLKIQFHPR